MERRQESLDQLKQRTYVVLFSVGLIGAVSAMFSNELIGTITPFTRGIFLLTIAFLGLQIWLVRGKKARIEVVEELLYVVIGTIVLCVFVYALYLYPSPELAHVSLLSVYLWLPFVYIFVFLAYGSRGALLRSGLLYLLILFVSLPRAIPALASKDPFESFSSFGQLYISSASIIAVLFFLTQMKDRLRETQAVAEQMTALAQTDGLTGIPNRRCIEQVIELEMERSRRYDLPLSLVIFDLDNFKRLNDTFGHDAGDRVLIEITQLVKPHLRANDQFGRWGGEEFMIAAPETTAESARRLAERIRTSIEDRDFGAVGRLSASFGIATYGTEDSTTTLVKRADVALYRAKTLGRNRVEVVEIAV